MSMSQQINNSNIKKGLSKVGSSKSKSIKKSSTNLSTSNLLDNLVTKSTATDLTTSSNVTKKLSSKSVQSTNSLDMVTLNDLGSNLKSNLNTNLNSNLNVLPKIHLPTVSSFNGNQLSIFSTHHFEPQNLSPQNLSKKFTNHPPQHIKVEQKNSTFYLIPTNIPSNKSAGIDKFNINEFSSSQSTNNSFEKSIMNKELVDIFRNLQKLTNQLEKKVNGRPNDVDNKIKQE